jgi:hypothetical protein
MKKCSKCEIEKPLTEFYKRGNGYKSQCKECSSIYGKEYYSSNKDIHNLKMIEHYVTNKEKYQTRQKKYRIDNKDKINNIAKIYTNHKRRTDPIFKLKHNLRVRIKEYLKSKNIKNTNTTLELIGCTPEFLRDYLENMFDEKMTWNNYGLWEIDHKIPLSQASTLDELYKLNYYSNLQPMWKHENIKKGAKLDF